MDLKANLGDIMKEAQKMQEKMQKAQQELANLEVQGVAGAGLVEVTLDGRHGAKRLNINPTLIEDGEKEMLEDLILAAFNDAVRKVEKASKEKIADLTAGLKLPPDLELPDTEE